MESERNRSDDLDVSLQWPDRDPAEQAPDRDSGEPAPKPAFPPRPDPEYVETDPHLAVQLAAGSIGENAQIPLASIAIRLEALSAATTMMRVAVSDRLSDLHDQLARAMSTTARDMDDYRRLHDRALADLRAQMISIETGLARVASEPGDIRQALDASLSQRLEPVSQAAEARLALLEEVRASLTELVATQRDRFNQLEAEMAATRVELKQAEAARAGAATEQASQLEQLAGRLEALEARPAAAPAVVQGLEALTEQVEALRRRMAVRARSEPYLDVAAIDSLADAIAERLHEPIAEATTQPSRRRRGNRP
jgi:chromosome segregation ATPase